MKSIFQETFRILLPGLSIGNDSRPSTTVQMGRANQSYHPVSRAVNDKRLLASSNLGTSIRDVLWKEADA